MEAILPHLVSLGTGGLIAFVLIYFTIPRIQLEHRRQVSELIAAFRAAVDKIGVAQDRHADRTAEGFAQVNSRLGAIEAQLRIYPRPHRPDEAA